MKTTLVLMVAALMLVACAPMGEETVVHIHPDMQCRDAVEGGLQFWRDQGKVFIVREASDAPMIGIFIRSGSVKGDRVVARMFPLGATKDIVVEDCRYGAQTIGHEIGHALGLKHHPVKTNLMYESTRGKNWDLDDVQLETVGLLP